MDISIFSFNDINSYEDNTATTSGSCLYISEPVIPAGHCIYYFVSLNVKVI